MSSSFLRSAFGSPPVERFVSDLVMSDSKNGFAAFLTSFGGLRLVERLRERRLPVDEIQVAFVARLDTVDAQRCREDIVFLDRRGGALVGRDAGVFEDLRRREELCRGGELERVVRFADRVAPELLPDRRDGVDVALLVIANCL